MSDSVGGSISGKNTIQQNWDVAKGDGNVTRGEAQQILDAAMASGGISMQELSGSREIARGAVFNNGGRNLGSAQWLRTQIADANLNQSSMRHIWETLKDI